MQNLIADGVLIEIAEGGYELPYKEDAALNPKLVQLCETRCRCHHILCRRGPAFDIRLALLYRLQPLLEFAWWRHQSVRVGLRIFHHSITDMQAESAIRPHFAGYEPILVKLGGKILPHEVVVALQDMRIAVENWPII